MVLMEHLLILHVWNKYNLGWIFFSFLLPSLNVCKTLILAFKEHSAKVLSPLLHFQSLLNLLKRLDWT